MTATNLSKIENINKKRGKRLLEGSGEVLDLFPSITFHPFCLADAELTHSKQKHVQSPEDADSRCLSVSFIILFHFSPSLAWLYFGDTHHNSRTHYQRVSAAAAAASPSPMHITCLFTWPSLYVLNFRSTVFNFVLKFVPVTTI